MHKCKTLKKRLSSEFPRAEIPTDKDGSFPILSISTFEQKQQPAKANLTMTKKYGTAHFKNKTGHLGGMFVQGCKIAYPEKKTPGSKWVVWLSASAKNCDRLIRTCQDPTFEPSDQTLQVAMVHIEMIPVYTTLLLAQHGLEGYSMKHKMPAYLLPKQAQPTSSGKLTALSHEVSSEEQMTKNQQKSDVFVRKVHAMSTLFSSSWISNSLTVTKFTITRSELLAQRNWDLICEYVMNMCGKTEILEQKTLDKFYIPPVNNLQRAPTDSTRLKKKQQQKKKPPTIQCNAQAFLYLHLEASLHRACALIALIWSSGIAIPNRRISPERMEINILAERAVTGDNMNSQEQRIF
ncbi:hypothetical protein EK904_011774 [Melospiza melodia maxima]|nr:hypothetical protein EK904_011774 [Melospiza melodia maxima]